MANGNAAGVGLVGLLLIAGVILFLFPEPVTSGLGMTLVVVAVIIWAVRELLRTGPPPSTATSAAHSPASSTVSVRS